VVVGNAARNRTVKLCLLLPMLDPQLPLDEEISREVAFKDTNINQENWGSKYDIQG